MADSTDASFDRYARIVRRALGVPVALVTIVEPARQVFLGAVGLPEPYQTTRATPLTHSFCQYVVKDEKPLVISDARHDDQLRHNLAIEDLNVVAYLGWPLTNADGAVIGSLCAIDSRPREWTTTDLAILEDLAGACSAELAERELRRGAGATASIERAIATQSQLLLALSEALSSTATVADIAAAVHQVAVDGLACNHGGIWLVDDRSGARDGCTTSRTPHNPGRRPSGTRCSRSMRATRSGPPSWPHSRSTIAIGSRRTPTTPTSSPRHSRAKAWPGRSCLCP